MGNADIPITAKVNMGEWEKGVANLTDLLYMYTGSGSMDAAAAVEAKTKAKLAETQHGPLQWSLSPNGAGRPPSMVSGDLLASINHARSGFTAAMVGPTRGYGRSGFYARIQELGGTMLGHPIMQFRKIGYNGKVRKFERAVVYLSDRPYLRPATEEAIADGSIERAYEFWWTQAIEQA